MSGIFVKLVIIEVVAQRQIEHGILRLASHILNILQKRGQPILQLVHVQRRIRFQKDQPLTSRTATKTTTFQYIDSKLGPNPINGNANQ